MVQVAAPAGWQPPSADAVEGAAAPSDAPSTSGRRRWENQVQPGEKLTEGAATPSSSGGLKFGDSSGGLADSSASSSSSISASALAGAAMQDSEVGPLAAPPVAGGGAAAAWGKWGLLAGVPTLVVALAATVWFFRRSPDEVPPPPEVAATEPAPPIEAPPPPATPPPDREPVPEPVRLARRWLPSNAAAVVSLRPKLLLAEPAARVVLDRTAAIWQAALDKLVSSLGLEPQSIDRATWSAVDIRALRGNDWLTQGVVAIELDKPLDAASPALRDGVPLDWTLAKAPARELKSRAWPNPFAVIDKRTVVTGPGPLLRELAAREEDRLANEALEELLNAADAKAAALALLDLRALRDADAVPHWMPVVELWHAEADDWQLLRTMPLAFRLAISLGKQGDVELELACDGASGAEEVHAALDRVLEAVEGTMAGEADSLSDKLLAGEINAALAGDLKQFLAGSQSALADRTSGLRDQVVWARLAWQGDLAKLAAGFLAGIPQLEVRRLAAVRRLDEEHHQLLLAGLAGYVKAERAWPAGAAGATLLAPETRLSWQATLLPYYGHLDWHGELNFARAWNDPLNQRVTRQPLDVMTNPALGPSKTTADFPVTHYVGVAGLGADAGQLEATDARAGVFGFRSRPTPAEIPDGASNTIALAGVSGKLGPWAAGGAATVRGLTQRPYINGPDGFGSGQPDGMLVGMADGSVRFLSKDIDPAVLERLATIHGGDPDPSVAKASTPDGGLPPRQPAQARTPTPRAKTAEKRSAKRTRPVPQEPDKRMAARLNDTIPGIELKTTLTDLLNLLSQLSTVPMTLDAESLAQAGVDPAAKVSLKLSNATIGEILDAGLRPYDLKYVMVGKQLIVMDARRLKETVETVRFKVADLVASSKQHESDLAKLVERFVVPTAWQTSGGPGSIEAAEGELVVKQTPSVSQQVGGFLDKLRLARQLPVARRERRPASLATRWSMAREKLLGNVTVNFSEPVPLAEIAAQLQKAAGIAIVFDGLGLAAVERSPKVEATLSTDREPLADVLDRLLEPLELGYRIVDGQVLQITSAREVSDDLDVEFYPAESFLQAEPADEFAARIRKEVSPATWLEMGGAGALEVDAASSYLMVLAPQGVQIELENWLAEQTKK